jgi:hypothetical protein
VNELSYKTDRLKILRYLLASAALGIFCVSGWADRAIAQRTAQRTAQNAAQTMTLSAGQAQAQGTTAGSYSLNQLAARDRRRRLCLGYGDRQPSHTLVLTEAAPRLRVAVTSSGDTTLLIQGPDGIDCNDNYQGNPDALVTGQNWPEGTYRIWVGAFEEGDQLNYELRVFDPRAASE